MSIKEQWINDHLVGGNVTWPFAFGYAGRSSREWLGEWPRQTVVAALDAMRTQRTTTWIDPATGLEVRCVAVNYADYPVVEWTVYFKNTGEVDAPILEALHGLDAAFAVDSADSCILHCNRGDDYRADSYQPSADTLAVTPGHAVRFAPNGGRASNGAFPYFNLQTADDAGAFVAVGWPGQWSASFSRDEAGVRVLAGQELVRIALKPGETIRTPLMALLFWQGMDVAGAHNLWRRWMLAHNLPKPAGKPLAPMLIMCSGGFFPGLKVSEASERQFIEAYVRERVPLTHWWMDAGWYPCDEWPQTGTWVPDPARFPNGIKAVSDVAHANGMQLILWFEPERVTVGSWLEQNYPEWLLGDNLLDLGNPAARSWLTDHVDRIITEHGIDLYRQDFNMDPLDNWRTGEAADRQGMHENQHVQGYLAYWDELRRRHPGMVIDSCASGGRRNDLETMRRAVPLLRSDYQSFSGDAGFAVGNQGHTYELSRWIPFYGQGVYEAASDQAYYVRSHMSPSFGICWDVRKLNLDWELYRRLVAQFQKVADLMLADYYPLTPYSLTEDACMAWQFHRPETDEGMVQVFRRSQCTTAQQVLHLCGLDLAASYRFTDLDNNLERTLTGSDLSRQGPGLLVEITHQPGSLLLRYCKAA